MKNELPIYTIDHTNFMRFKDSVNLAGDPTRDRFGSNARKAVLVIPDDEMAMDMEALGLNVRHTHPREGEEEGFIPTHYVNVIAKYESKWPPRINLINREGAVIELDADSVGMIDRIFVDDVRAVLRPWFNDKNGKWSLYIQTMYVKQGIDRRDPFRGDYNSAELPFA